MSASARIMQADIMQPIITVTADVAVQHCSATSYNARAVARVGMFPQDDQDPAAIVWHFDVPAFAWMHCPWQGWYSLDLADAQARGVCDTVDA